MKGITTGRMPHIDGWRAIAVTLVILGHLAGNTGIKEFYTTSHLNYIGAHAQTGVFIFFFISGHVVGSSCLTEVARSSNFSMRAFYLRRAFRIIPPLLIYLAFCAIMGQIGLIDFSVHNFAIGATFLCNVGTTATSCGWYGGHTWSLAFEEQFYIVFPLLFSYIELKRRPSLVKGVLAAGILLVPFIWPLHYVGRTGFVIIYALFIFGYLSAKYANADLGMSKLAGAAVLVCAAFLTFAPAETIASLLWDLTEQDRQLIGKYYKMVHAVSIPILVLSTGMARSLLNEHIGNPILAYSGRASYSIYLWQQFVTGPLFAHTAPLVEIAALFFIVAACVVSYEFMELPLIRAGRRLAARDSVRTT